MVWFKVDDNLAFHRKTVMAGTAAMGLWVRAGSWSMHTLTDGFVPTHMVAALSDGQPELARNLVKSGLWKQVDGGYIFHEWDQRQPSREEVEAKSQVRAEAGRKGGLRSGQVRGSHGSKTEANASSKDEQRAEAESSSSLNPDPARPVPARTEEGQETLSGIAPLTPDPTRPDVEKLCDHLKDRITANGSKATITKQWRNEARLLLDRDKRTVDEALWLIDWATNHHFWAANIRSMPKFREKYDQLRLQAKPLAAQSKGDKAFADALAIADRIEARESNLRALPGGA